MADTINLRELLLFYADSGADDALMDEAVDRFAATEQPVIPASATKASAPQLRAARAADRPTPAAPTRAQTSVPDEGQSERARLLAREAMSLEALREAMQGFDGCNLALTAKSLVFGEGDVAADILFIGDAPGRDEDIEGRPYVGRSGQLLDRMMAAIGLDRSNAYLAHVIPWRPPGNRAPTAIEIEICRPFLERQIELVQPKLLVPLGDLATKVMSRSPESIVRVRGKWWQCKIGEGSITALSTFDPDYLLRNPPHKKLAWRDLLEIKAKLGELSPR